MLFLEPFGRSAKVEDKLLEESKHSAVLVTCELLAYMREYGRP